MPRLSPSWVMATCFHTPVGSAAALICCSPPAPPLVIAFRSVPAPLLGVRTMFAPVPVRKSKMRDHVASASSLTQPATEYATAPVITSWGSTRCPSAPSSASAPPRRPAVVHAAPPARAAALPLPDESAAALPEVSSSLYQAANGGGGGGGAPVRQ